MASFLLLETGDLILQEDGFSLLLEDSVSNGTYNEGLYGGSMATLPKLATLSLIDTLRPEVSFVQKALGQFTDSTITYSSATNTYNSGLYGGMDREQPVVSTLNSIDSAKPVVYRIDKL